MKYSSVYSFVGNAIVVLFCVVAIGDDVSYALTERFLNMNEAFLTGLSVAAGVIVLRRAWRYTNGKK